MAISLTVSQVRQSLRQHLHAHSPGAVDREGEPTTAALGTIFHQIAAQLIQDDSRCSLRLILKDQDRDPQRWRETIRYETYDRLFGPILTQRAASLEGRGGEVLRLWTAIENLCDFLVDLWWEMTDRGNRDVQPSRWWIAEQPVVCELHRDDWPEPVVLLGQADAVLRVPGQGHWCVIDWKTGRASPQLDLLQACLYQMILQQSDAFPGDAFPGDPSRGDASPGVAPSPNALAVVSFQPELTQSVFTAAQIETVRDRLLDVIGRLAKAGAKAEDRQSNRDRPAPGTNRSIQSPARFIDDASADSPEWQKRTMDQVLSVLQETNAPCKTSRPAAVGASFVRFYVLPQKGVTPKRVMASSETLHLRLGLSAEPVMSIDDGAVAIDLPRPDRQSLPWSRLIDELPAVDQRYGSARLPIGMDLNGHWQWCDLAASESCHLLVVGTPGSGKTEWLRSAIATLLCCNTRQSLDLRLIDPKRNAFNFAESHPMLHRPIWFPGDATDASEMLEELVHQMTDRNVALQQSNSRTLREHLEKTGEPMPRVILVCDEYADLLDGSSKQERQNVESMLKRIAQIGRAPGFHLVLATQQPRANIITTAIRSLLPAKIAMRVADATESRVAIEQKGAQQLLGNGDLLYKCIGINRLQGPWLPSNEESLVDNISNHSPLNDASTNARVVG